MCPLTSAQCQCYNDPQAGFWTVEGDVCALCQRGYFGPQWGSGQRMEGLVLPPLPPHFHSVPSRPVPFRSIPFQAANLFFSLPVGSLPGGGFCFNG